jgi:cyclic-di-GMP phosphodiesterase TipF (flagellum assembly factor)
MTPRSMPPVRRGPEPFLGAVIEVPPLEDQEQGREAALIAAFDADGLEVHLQPVVTLPQRKVAAYEALARLRVAGEVLAPEVFLPVLERHGRTTDLDRRMLQRVATIARHLAGRGSEAAVGYGLSPLSLYEPGFLRSLARLVASEPGLAGRLVVALPQASWRNLDAEQIGALAAMRGKIGFILDRPTDLRFDALSLAERGVAQVKVSADLLLRQASARQNLSDIAVEDLVAALARAGIRLVATAVERETDVPDLIDLDVPFAQGSVFAAPRAVRADVLAAAAPIPRLPAPRELNPGVAFAGAPA